MEHKKKLIHVTRMPIRWGDMDAYGHVNNTVYFRYMEQARVEVLGAQQYKGASGNLAGSLEQRLALEGYHSSRADEQIDRGAAHACSKYGLFISWVTTVAPSST